MKSYLKWCIGIFFIFHMFSFLIISFSLGERDGSVGSFDLLEGFGNSSSTSFSVSRKDLSRSIFFFCL